MYDIERKVSRYLLTITLINAGLGIVITIALAVIGLDYAYIWGSAAFLLNFVPFVGALVGTAMVAAYAIVSFDSVSYAFLAPAAYLLLTVVEGQFVTPTLVGRRLEMNTVAVFLTVVLWGWLWGVPGALVAVPFLVVFKVICENFEGLETMANFLGKSDEKPYSKPV
jgi:predicted PurR-regulated permease PerM